MKKTVIILGFISTIVAVVFSVTPLYNLAITPLIIAFICGLVLVFLSKKDKSKPKAIQYIFILIIMSLSLTIYKGVFDTSEVGNAEPLELKNEKNQKDSKEFPEKIEANKAF
ncbi:FUSC family protein [Winogradskyella wichelsiae]|uniref:FUSC family protein n=1 Tax=Winogradskyella wichelsiae TaxID=2697007 RepID=UPI003EF1D750